MFNFVLKQLTIEGTNEDTSKDNSLFRSSWISIIMVMSEVILNIMFHKQKVVAYIYSVYSYCLVFLHIFMYKNT